MTAIVAALPREIAGLVRGFRADAELKRKGIYLYRLNEKVQVACAGMGSTRVLLAARAVAEVGSLKVLISTGLAGGCDPWLSAGTVLEAGCVVDARSGERWDVLPGGNLTRKTLVTSDAIASVREKQRLHATYGAAMVDMEAATLARFAQMHGVGFRAIKAVSDAHDFELESLSRFASPRGHFRTGAFALHTALRPHRWGAAMQLGSGSQRALRAVTETLKELMK